MSFKEIYKTPFSVPREFGGMYAFTANKTKVFTAFDENAKMHMKNIVNILNGETFACKYAKEEIKTDKAKIIVKDYPILIRGWGNLIGSGGLNLNPKEAAKIQDDFIKWIIEEITE